VGGAYIAIGLSAPQRAGPRAAIDGSGGQRPSGSARVDRRRLRPDPGPYRSDDPVVGGTVRSVASGGPTTGPGRRPVRRWML